jgi:hypothetical protein
MVFFSASSSGGSPVCIAVAPEFDWKIIRNVWNQGNELLLFQDYQWNVVNLTFLEPPGAEVLKPRLVVRGSSLPRCEALATALA